MRQSSTALISPAMVASARRGPKWIDWLMTCSMFGPGVAEIKNTAVT